MTNEQLTKRLECIEKDAMRIYNFIYHNNLDKEFSKPTEFSDEAWNLLENILIACDLNSDESDSWKNPSQG